MATRSENVRNIWTETQGQIPRKYQSSSSDNFGAPFKNIRDQISEWNPQEGSGILKKISKGPRCGITHLVKILTTMGRCQPCWTQKDTKEGQIPLATNRKDGCTGKLKIKYEEYPRDSSTGDNKCTSAWNRTNLI